MGWGKTTYMMVHLYEEIKRNIYITLPSVALATDVFASLSAAANMMKSKYRIGMKIDSTKIEG